MLIANDVIVALSIITATAQIMLVDRYNATLGCCHVCLSVVCVTHACIVTKQLKHGSHGFYLKVAPCLLSSSGEFDDEIRRSSLEQKRELKVGVVI